MLNTTIQNRKGQIAQTMNWVVATIIIVIVLTISFFVVTKGETGQWILPDKQKDFVATKSIVNFVDINSNLIEDSIVSGNYSDFDKKFNPFLWNLSVVACDNICRYRGAWNLRFEGKVFAEHDIILYSLGDKDLYYVDFIFPIKDKQIKLKFWEASGWINL